MVVVIGLARADYEQLLQKVPMETPAFAVLRRCPELHRWGREEPLFKCVIIECNPDEALVLLEAAKQHCERAVADIEYGLKLSRAFDLIS
jgi:predicted NAD/FAD-binding protein